MGLFIAAGIYIIYCIMNKMEEKQGSKKWREYQEDKKRRGLKYYE